MILVRCDLTTKLIRVVRCHHWTYTQHHFCQVPSHWRSSNASSLWCSLQRILDTDEDARCYRDHGLMLLLIVSHNGNYPQAVHYLQEVLKVMKKRDDDDEQYMDNRTGRCKHWINNQHNMRHVHPHRRPITASTVRVFGYSEYWTWRQTFIFILLNERQCSICP